MNKLSALVEAANKAIEAPEAHMYQKHWQHYMKLTNPATILELCALLEKAEEALEEATALCTNYEAVEEPQRLSIHRSSCGYQARKRSPHRNQTMEGKDMKPVASVL